MGRNFYCISDNFDGNVPCVLGREAVCEVVEDRRFLHLPLNRLESEEAIDPSDCKCFQSKVEDRLKPGTRVAFEALVFCRKCRQCRSVVG